MVQEANPRNISLLRSRTQSVDGHSEVYNNELQPGEASFEDIYHDVWRIFFTPNKTVAALIEKEIDRMGLVPGEYVASHMRALYGRIVDRKKSVAEDWTKNAVHCASTLRPGGPILFASDHTYSQEVALEYGRALNTTLVSRIHDKLPLHMDKAENWTSLSPSDFYDVFVDLYLMGMGRCVSTNLVDLAATNHASLTVSPVLLLFPSHR